MKSLIIRILENYLVEAELMIGTDVLKIPLSLVRCIGPIWTEYTTAPPAKKLLRPVSQTTSSTKSWIRRWRTGVSVSTRFCMPKPRSRSVFGTRRKTGRIIDVIPVKKGILNAAIAKMVNFNHF